MTHLVIPYLHARSVDLDGYKRVAELCNKAAQKSKAAGISLPTTIMHSSSTGRREERLRRFQV